MAKDSATTAVIAVAAIGALGAGLYLLLNNGKCIDGTYGEETVCEDGTKIHEQICIDGEIKDSGQYCPEDPEPQVNCIQAARKCVAGRAMQCQNHRWVDVGTCDTLSCPLCASAAYDCEGTNLLYEYQCDPYSVPRACNYTMYRTADPICINRVPSKMRVGIDNQYSVPGTALGLEIYPEGNCCGRPEDGGCYFSGNHAIYPVNEWVIEVRDVYNDLIANADVWIVATNRCKSLFMEHSVGMQVDPSSYQDQWEFGELAHCGPFPKGTFPSKTNSSGIAKVTSMGILDPGVNSSRVEAYRVYVSRDGVTLYQDVNLRFFGQNGTGSSTSCISHYNYDPWGCTY